ncbi:hypothetical protein [Shimia haliotis]|uniref:Phytanoyl-CoA dioxygenase (PhyH) n=1 Tax=Shimia haliotis TaxID=1280847 RepID=A0A1I4BKK2_9RHOB|nr:hypothetical protein [Shimia haliotis]SFK68506.1 hypothetical protein SAMN04488036_1011054 [Shimia haliotis]
MSPFFAKGWSVLPFDARVKAWAKAAWLAGQDAMRAPEMAQWWACENTWFIGVDALPNDPSGAIGGVALDGAPLSALTELYGPLPELHSAQLSVVTAGYPRPRDNESEAAFGYRLRRDAAHIDGLKRGPKGERLLEEPHHWLLGLPLTTNIDAESPLVVWEGSHEVMRAALGRVLMEIQPQEWAVTDISEAYQAARREVFASCRRVPVLAQPGEAVLVHRLCLHGVAPWEDHGANEANLRGIAYFRPVMIGDIRGWITQP